MIKDNSDDQLLNKLYAQSAIEKPPEDLDQEILELAKTHHQRTRFAKTMNLQRVLSVAAVMVLSVYIFFEVGSDRSMSIDEDVIHPQKSNLRSSPSAPQPDSLELKDAANLEKQVKKKEAKKSVEKELMGDAKDHISDLASEVQEQNKSDMSAPSSSPALLRQKPKTELAKEPAKAIDMLKEIETLLASGELEEAKRLYEQFKLLFPEYPVPVAISKAFDNKK